MIVQLVLLVVLAAPVCLHTVSITNNDDNNDNDTKNNTTTHPNLILMATY